MARMNDLDKLTYAELSELRVAVDAAMAAAKVAERKDLLAKMEALAAEAGLSLDDVLGAKRGRKGALKGTTVAVKYRNPKDDSQTWSGRGRRPVWMVAAEKKGQKVENFLV